MHKITIFPLGNADCCRIDLAIGTKILFDYANTRCADDTFDKRIDLPTELRKDLDDAKRDSYDVVAFTHLDDDHICGSTEFFELQHAKKYQGGNRVKIATLWVPASVICEDKDDLHEEAKTIQAEARYRLEQGKDIRVFSRPAALEAWLKSKGLTLESRAHLITDAGQVIPGFTKAYHGVEFFVHSPFASRQDDGTFVDCNTSSLVVQATFLADDAETKFILAADSTHEVLSEIVKITKFHGREERLEWDVFKLPHHCSYLSLGPDKGKDKTQPVADVKWIFETKGMQGATVVSTSEPIPSVDTDQPPHRQAANYYHDVREKLSGQFIVTMEHPKSSAPESLVITIDRFKVTIQKRAAAAAGVFITSRPAPRAGARRP